MKDLNRIKVMLVEKKKNEQVAGRTVGEKYIYGKQMVYEHLSARLADS